MRCSLLEILTHCWPTSQSCCHTCLLLGLYRVHHSLLPFLLIQSVLWAWMRNGLYMLSLIQQIFIEDFYTRNFCGHSGYNGEQDRYVLLPRQIYNLQQRKRQGKMLQKHIDVLHHPRFGQDLAKEIWFRWRPDGVRSFLWDSAYCPSLLRKYQTSIQLCFSFFFVNDRNGIHIMVWRVQNKWFLWVLA